MQVSAVKNSLNSQVLFAGKEKKAEAPKQNYTMYKDHFVRNTAIAAGLGAALNGIPTKSVKGALVGSVISTAIYYAGKTVADHFRREGKGESDNLGKNLVISAGLGSAALAVLAKVKKFPMKLGALCGIFAGIGLYLLAKTPYDQITKK